jgi:hypothetical protein
MAKKKFNWKDNLLMIIYWALYLTITMSLFERFHVVPGVVPGGFIGWMFIVEVPRVFVGWIISIPIFKYKQK